MKNWIIVSMIFALTTGLWAITGDEIIERSDAQQRFDTMKSTGIMRADDRFGTIESTFISHSRGDNEFLLEFTNIEEQGQKVLRVDGDIYLYDPDAEETLRMSGSSLKDSMFGDISYEDVSEGNDTLSKYDAALLKEEAINGVNCYLVELTAKTRSVPYHRQLLWIRVDNLVLLRGEYYSRRGTLLKEIRVLETMEIGGKVVLSHLILEDKVREDSSTELIMNNIEVNIELDDRMFTEEALF
ncbi:MAG: outer membrane lipoprotein-sorting protein [Spirochaetaceae bacterium]|jgi:negative regulator of sigma E activity|nr:outer membrane lipoprotein-sorting protein [Spirochaetaceae bacterium]